MDILDIKNISFSYDSKDKIIDNLSFKISENKFISIVGSSGCGKSTLIKLIGGIEDLRIGKINSKSIAYMPQKDLLLPWRTILENILLPLEISKKRHKETEEKAKYYLEKFNLLKYKDSYPHELSGGMKQKVSFIRTLLTEASVFLLDEPFSSLDAITKGSMQEWLLDIFKELDKTFIFVTHDINEALFLSDTILVCKNKPLDSFEIYNLESSQKQDILYINKIKASILKNIGGEF